MAVHTGLLAVVPAPAGTPPEKILATIAFARQSREIMKVIVTSDQPLEEAVTTEGAWFFKAPASLLSAPVPRLALLAETAAFYEKRDGERVRMVLHLDPLRPMSDPLVIFECFQRIMINAYADGIVGVSKTGRGLAERGEFLAADPNGPLVIDGSVYMIEHDFLIAAPPDWFSAGKFLAYHSAPASAPSRGTFL
jgi:hypothetical protein